MGVFFHADDLCLLVSLFFYIYFSLLNPSITMPSITISISIFQISPYKYLDL